MRVLFDTSVLVAGIVQDHPAHAKALPWLQRAHAGEFEFLVAAHTLAELYSVLTTLPVSPRIPPALAARLIQENVQRGAKVIALSPRDYAAVIREMAELQRSGGSIYDALIVRAAIKGEAQRLLTLNPKHFLRVWPQGAEALTAP